MSSKRTIANTGDAIEDFIEDRLQNRFDERIPSPAGSHEIGRVGMIKDLSIASGDATQRSGKGGKSGGGLGGQKAGGIKGGGKRKTHFGRKQGTGGR